MNVTRKNLPRGQAELTIEIPPDEYQPFLEQAAAALSTKISIPGFRPGHVPLGLVANRVGDAKLWEEALEPAVKRTYTASLRQEHLSSIGSPHITVTKLAPGNPVVYRAVVNLLPEVEVADFASIKVSRRTVAVADSDVNQTIENLRKVNRSERLVLRPAKSEDKVEIKLETFHAGVPVESGQSPRLPLVLGEGRFLPGFEQQIIGMSAGLERRFQLLLPPEYHQRQLAGKTVEFHVTVIGVYELTLPPLDDAFAKSLGKFETLENLHQRIRETLRAEAERKEDERLEMEILDAIISRSRFTDIPDLLVSSETKSMVEQLERDVAGKSISFDEYLGSLKKTRAELLLDLAPSAIKRIKGALLTRAIAANQGVNVSDDEVTAAITKEFAAYADDREARERTKEPGFRPYVRNILASRKVMEYLKNAVVSK